MSDSKPQTLVEESDAKIGTTGHDWDGIKELNNPLPRWWLWTFYATIVWGVIYTVLYPAWPLVNGATAGVFGWSTRGEVAAEQAAFAQRNTPLANALAAADLPQVAADTSGELHRYAVSSGAAVFRTHCSQCHGSGAAGAIGYPNLLDSDWLWGGSVSDIAMTVRHGIRNDTDGDARWSQMPAFGEILSNAEIDAVVEHVREISDQEHDIALAATGAEVFASNCASCHGDAGEGMRDEGAPDLSDAIWLYGGDRDALHTTVNQARFGVMPAWGARLSDAEVAAVATYVHQLGGGEAEIEKVHP
ncbi:cytochrome-c oxidase, cbb3-type subunit III [Puniceibacterium sp. IMCC21224]|uniref:cytochrome-c oxidase, cbb3-type subunit III n=1 Tax=Puniceibacterium sp. IMCC21224 TaxID=1618204 RepID=UPI00064DE33A|nr:cytochrome-c oxidase, cbb3-type subunit III [Puniceibacterium sp. IMCC21224]KMK67533.1 cytochrome c oxidase, cbb3-type, subunit III [Puniceibacterium sp. IMCC21224]